MPATQTIFPDGIECGTGGTSGNPPVVTFLTTGPVYRYTPIIYTVVLVGAALRRVVVRARFVGLSPPVWDFVYDGTGFGPFYVGPTNRVEVIADGLQFTNLRDGGWPRQPILTAFAVSRQGVEA